MFIVLFCINSPDLRWSSLTLPCSLISLTFPCFQFSDFIVIKHFQSTIDFTSTLFYNPIFLVWPCGQPCIHILLKAVLIPNSIWNNKGQRRTMMELRKAALRLLLIEMSSWSLQVIMAMPAVMLRTMWCAAARMRTSSGSSAKSCNHLTKCQH